MESSLHRVSHPLPPQPGNGVMPSSTFFFVQRISRLSHYTIGKHQIKVNETESIRFTSLNKWKRKDFIVCGIAWEKQELIEPAIVWEEKNQATLFPAAHEKATFSQLAASGNLNGNGVAWSVGSPCLSPLTEGSR